MKTAMSNHYLECLLESLNDKTEETSDWLKQLRAQAIDRVSQLRFPTTKDEEWRFTDVSPLEQLPFKPAQTITTLKQEAIQQFFVSESTNRLVFIDGFYAPELSSLNDSNSCLIGNLSSMVTNQSSLAASHLGRHVHFQDNIFAALNTAFLQDAAVIVIPRNVTVTDPIHLLFVATQEKVTHSPRCLIIGESNSQATIIEDYVPLQQHAYITNSVTEFSLAENAQVNHVRVQRESNMAFHLSHCTASLERHSRFHSVDINFGGLISRFNLDIQFKAEEAECAIDGLTMITGKQLADTHTSIDHAKAHCTSHQQHKCIVDDNAHAVFNGKIMVRPHAQRTDSSQSSRNLLLSGAAQIDTKPQLEIFADDVKCAHGVTVGQLDNEEIFYLKSRGLPDLAARNLLTYAFGAEILDRIPVASLKRTLEQTVLNQTQNLLTI